MICPSCNTENERGRKFCKECAAPLARACANCGAANASDAKFCGECASPLTDAAAPASPAASTAADAPVAERRLVSVLFADLVGFTTLAEGRDAEDVRELLTRYFDLARETIERYGGTVEKFIGDAVMAVWGTPVTREDDSERAVRTALELVSEVRGLGPGIQARAGVLTGEAAVTLGATNQGMVAGDIVNTAARLQSVAEPGTVLVGEATYRFAEAAIAFEAVGEATLKGKATPVPAWRALRVVAERGGLNRSPGLEAPFVGRDEELRVLKEAVHATSREGKSRLVSVVGPAGIGKSRLAWEFLKYVDGVKEEIWWHSGRSPAYGDGITFWALGEMVRRRAKLLETDDEETTRSAVTSMLEEHVPDPSERRWIEPAMLALLGVEGATDAPSEELFAAWRTFFERMATSGTVIMSFEDLHWADSGTLDFIDHLLEWARDAPICILTHARPELLDRRPTWGAGKRQFTSLYLEPLTEAAMRELLLGLVPGLPEKALHAIIARADGVPLYAVETVRALVAEGRLAEVDGAYVPTGDLAELSVPDSLTALISGRLDALDPVDRALLQTAAVLGQSFTLAGLAAVTGEDASALEPRLLGLVRREMLVLRADPRAPDRGQYAFVQSLVREVAYNTLAKRDRKARHLAAARFFESLPTDELAGALAGQYLAAHENAQPGEEADALAAQARVALKSAAERAIALGAFAQAQSLLQQAITVTTAPRELAELEERAGDAAGKAGHYDVAAAHLERAIATYRAEGDRPAAARAIATLATIDLDARRTEAAIAALEPAVQEFADLGDDPARIALSAQLARAYMFQSEFARSVTVADEVLPVAERLDRRDLLADALITKGSALGFDGRPREGLCLVQGGAELAASMGLAHTELRARVNASAFIALDDYRAAWDSDREAAALARKLGYRSLEMTLVSNAASNGTIVGEWDEALALVRAIPLEELDEFDQAQLKYAVYTILAQRGEPYDEVVDEVERLLANEDAGLQQMYRLWIETTRAVIERRFADAAAAFRGTAGATGGIGGGAEAYLDAARCALWAGDVEAARKDLETNDALGFHGRMVDAARAEVVAGIAALEGRTSEAVGLYREARRTYNELGIFFVEACVCLSTVLCLPEPASEIAAAAERGREIFGRLGARPFIEMLDARLASRDGGRVVSSQTVTETATPSPA